MEEKIFEIIVHSGNARSKLYEALEQVRNGNTDVERIMNDAKDEMVLAHNVQTELITDELNNNIDITLLLIHAQDQFMTVMSEQALIEQLIIMQKEINVLRK